MDKKQYEEVQIEVIKFTSKDVIRTSDDLDGYTPGASGNGNG